MSTKNYLTPAGYKKLRDEFTQLIEVERPKIVEAVSVAAAMGDRSENAEYIYGKRRLREIDSRLRFLQNRLDDVDIVDPETVDTKKVAFGTWVLVEQEDKGQHWYQIVGQDEIDPDKGRITYSSPIGRALLGKTVSAVVSVETPKGPIEIEILKIARSPL